MTIVKKYKTKENLLAVVKKNEDNTYSSYIGVTQKHSDFAKAHYRTEAFKKLNLSISGTISTIKGYWFFGTHDKNSELLTAIDLCNKMSIEFSNGLLVIFNSI